MTTSDWMFIYRWILGNKFTIKEIHSLLSRVYLFSGTMELFGFNERFVFNLKDFLNKHRVER
jgi:hypothetical protein